MELNTYYKVWQDLIPIDIYIVYTLNKIEDSLSESYKCKLSSDSGYNYGIVAITPSYWDNVVKLSSLEVELL
jgi:hypothetical protein